MRDPLAKMVRFAMVLGPITNRQLIGVKTQLKQGGRSEASNDQNPSILLCQKARFHQGGSN